MKRWGWFLVYLLSVHIMALLLFSAFRFVLFLSVDYQLPEDIHANIGLQFIAFLRGLWFDNVIACYIVLPPLVMLWITALIG
ncbi:MAG: LTA synthase family protein, partial [Bacteroides sp.]